MKKALVFTALLVCSLGAGCWNRPAAPAETAVPEFLPRQDVKAPGDAWREYEQAKATTDTSHTEVVDSNDKRKISLNIPSSWEKGDGNIWRPKDEGTLNHLRAQYFPSMGAATEWSNQQEQEDIHETLHASQDGDLFLLFVNHKSLKTSMLKLFRADLEHPGEGFFFVECRVAFDAKDRGALWSACKAAMESATFEVL